MKKGIVLHGLCVLLILTAVGCGTKEVPSDSMAGNDSEKDIQVTGVQELPVTEAPVSYEPLNVSVEIENRVYFMDEEAIPFQVINQSDKLITSALIPVLEKWTKTGWESVKCTAGFCGTHDQVDEIENGSILLEWYPELEPGNYRVSVSLTAPDGDVTVSDSFILLKDESFLPAEGEAAVTMDVTVVPSEEGNVKVNYVLTNLSSQEGFFGLDFVLERLEEDEWIVVPMKEGTGWNDIGLVLPVCSFRAEAIDLSFYFEDLWTGEYRLTKTVYMGAESTNVSAEFELEGEI